MATKPVVLPNIWANNGVYNNGPFVGSPQSVDPGAVIATSGHRPGALWPTAAEHENFQQLQITTWVRQWLSAGSFAGASDAHIVETGPTGRTALTGLDVTNTVSESGVISITNGGLLPSFFGRNEVGPVFRAITLAGPGPAFKGDLQALGTGLRLTMTSQAGASGNAVHITSDINTTRDAILIDMTGAGGGLNASTNNGDSVVAASVNGFGVKASSDTNFGVTGTSVDYIGGYFESTNYNALEALADNGIGVRSVTVSGNAVDATTTSGVGGKFASTDNIGVDATSTNDTAVSGVSINSNGGFFTSTASTGVRAFSVNGNAIIATASISTAVLVTSTSGTGVAATATSGIGVVGTSNTGIGVRAISSSNVGILSTSTSNFGVDASATAYWALRVTGDTTSPTRGEVLFSGQNARPTDNTAGSFSYLSSEGQFAHANALDAAWRGIWSSPGGYCRGYSSNSNTFIVAGGGYQNLSTASLSDGDAPKVANRSITVKYTIRARAADGAGTVDPTVFFIRIRDVTSNSIVAPLGVPTQSFICQVLSDDSTVTHVGTFFALVTPPTAGGRSYRPEIQIGGVDDMFVTCELELLGQN
jgi:hypothetical protein